jgi:hypothetical protein
MRWNETEGGPTNLCGDEVSVFVSTVVESLPWMYTAPVVRCAVNRANHVLELVLGPVGRQVDGAELSKDFTKVEDECVDEDRDDGLRDLELDSKC